jgi:co-chaperonin GroES (HSP10)
MNVTKLLGNRVVIEPLPAATETPGGIVIPERQVKKQPIGHVRMIGTTDEACEPKGKALLDEIKVGDLVYTDVRQGAQDIDFAGQKCRVHSIYDVLCVLG